MRLGSSIARSLMFATFAIVVDDRASDSPPDKYTQWSTDREIFVPMRDGVHLSTTLARPIGALEKLSTLLLRVNYDDASKLLSSHEAWWWLDSFVKQGYAVVLQDERGRGYSEGYYKNFLQNAATDGYDTIDWIVKQPWSNGRVGTIGCSNSGDVQWPLAAANHPGHAAMLPGATWAVGNISGNHTRGGWDKGGVPLLAVNAWAYSRVARSERLIVPPNSTQEQRIRLRNTYSNDFLYAKDFLLTDHSSALMHLPSQDILRALGAAFGPFDNYITWTPGDPRWSEVEMIGRDAKPRVPALMVSTWHDGFAGEVTRLFQYLQRIGTPDQYLIVGPGPHCSFFSSEDRLSDLQFGDLEIGDARYAGRGGYKSLFMDWFDHWLNGEPNHVTDMPKVQIYVMGLGWLSGDRWPLKDVHYTNYYLSGDHTLRPPPRGGALLAGSPARAGVDRYLYDPGEPTPSKGGVIIDGESAQDQRLVEARKDVLIYSTPPLKKAVTIAGPVEVVLYVSSSAKDTDFMVKLVDMYPDGKSINLSDDAFRVRYREGFQKKTLMEPGTVYKITLANMVTAIRFPQGHRIGLDISSSSFPEYERNLNTGGNNFDETSWVIAENSVHYGLRYPSHIVLPVLPD